MYFITNGHLAYLKIAKNACSSWEQVLTGLGWKTQDLYIPDQPLDDLIFFGLLREPDDRHTRGVVQYLINENLVHLLKDENFQRLLVSAVFDEHSYNIHSMVPSEIIKRTNWFIIDHKQYNYEQLVRNFLRQHNVDLPPVPKMNVSPPQWKELQSQVNDLKVKYHDSHQKLAKNFLGADLRLYRTQTLTQNRWDIPN